jgi:hypothetical protein
MDRVAVDSAAATCNHAVHDLSESTSNYSFLVAPLTARGHGK